MDEIVLYNYWINDLSRKKMRKSEGLFVDYNCKTILGFVVLGCGIILLFLVENLFEEQKMVLLSSLVVISIALILLLRWLFKKENNLICYVDKNNNKVDIHKLRELKVNLFVEKYCKDNKLELDSVYSILIDLCGYRISNMQSFSFSNYFSVLALLIALCTFLFTILFAGKHLELEIGLKICNYLLLIFLLLTIMYLTFKTIIDREKNTYVQIRFILCRTLLNKKTVKKKGIGYLLSGIIDLFRR